MDVIENIGLVGICDQYKPSYQTYAYFIDWNGNLKWMVPLNTRGNIIVKFKKDKKKVIVCSSRGYLFCIDIFSGKILWQHKEKWAQTGVVASHPPHKPLFDEVAIDKNYIYVKGSYENEEQEWYNSALLIFNIDNGQLIQRKEYINKRIFLRTLKDKIFTIDIDNRTVKQFKME
jgi:outer membrane protein assembly factor BamB